MEAINRLRNTICLLLASALLTAGLSACASREKEPAPAAPDTSRYLVAVEDEPDTVDFQCTTIYYTVATNVFNRLVEMKKGPDGTVSVEPSLAESWTVSPDGRSYSFRLREGVTFSNGSPLTASDVLYTLKRLLTHPGTVNRDIAEVILGAGRLESGQTDRLEGFLLLGELDFTITLKEPFEAFLACLSMPGASILDEESTEAVGALFGKDPAGTVGTGSFILETWVPGEGMTLRANPDCWEGPPQCDGLDLRFLTEPEDIRLLFEAGELDILNLDDVGSAAEFFLRGDIYRDRLVLVPRIGTTYIALNESVEPLTDVRVRQALQMALNRSTLLMAAYSGYGTVVNGIYPPGLYGYDPTLQPIPYDPEWARDLLRRAGWPDGFDLTFSVRSSTTQREMTLIRLAASMWEKIGVRANIEVLDEDTFMQLRKAGRLACYCAMWTADYNDPDNFIYTFFGSEENTLYRSLCYPREDIMARVRAARAIPLADARVEEYRALERIIVQQDAAWIPLFSRQRIYVTSERLEGLPYSWNGSVINEYREIRIK